MSEFRMWYIPQIPMPPFTREFDTAREAQAALDLIFAFSFFEFENRVKPDYTDAGGIEIWDEDAAEWGDYDDFEDEI